MHRIFTALTALGLCTALAAQNDYALDKTAAGTLGGQLGLRVRSAPANAFMVVMLSRNGGPTALATFDPTDPRSGQVGLELSALWFTMFTDGAGAADINLAMPVIPSLHGWALHWQTLTFPGTSHVVDKISNDVVTQFGTAGATVALPAVLAAARAFPTALWNRSFNAGAGDVVLAGGGSGTLTSASGLASSEIYDFRHMTVRAGPNLTGTRAVQTATELQDGRWLLTGGSDSTATVLSSCEIYDPVANTFTATASMSVPRAMHAAARLPDGRVMVAGGTTTLSTLVAAITAVQSSVEIWSPTTGTWTPGPALSGLRLAPALTTLNTGRVMCSGGVQITLFLGLPLAASSTTMVQLYDPATNAWSAGASMLQGRAGHHYNQVTLNDGRVLMTGGVNVPNLAGAASASSINNAEYYTPGTNTWTAANMVNARSLHSASLLADGRVAVCGGAQGTLTAPVSIDNVEVFSPTTNTWSGAGPMSAARSAHGAAVLPDGLLVLFGGQGTAATQASIETLHF